MPSNRLPVIVTLAVLWFLSAGLGAAQGPPPPGTTAPQAAVSSAFTYQGELKRDGSPIDATCAMTFTLYDDAAAGSPVGSPVNADVAVADGLFTVALDFGADSFTGSARWLEVAVRCPGDAGASTLDPRQALTAAPYALSLQPGAVISGTAFAAPLGRAAVLTAHNSASLTAAAGLYGLSDSTAGYGVRGYATADSGESYGVYGRSDSTAGYGVYGLAAATSGAANGVYGESASTAGRAVYGWASATSGTTYGVVGFASSVEGYGVYGVGVTTTGENCGVYGHSNSNAGRGVVGYANALSGSTYGVYGQSDSTAGRGVAGYADAVSGFAYGVYGESSSADGRGVSGYATATSGTNFGVFGRAESTHGRGVGGIAYATSGESYGLHGVSHSSEGRAVGGFATAATGTTYGVYGASSSSQGRGVYGIAADSSCVPGSAVYCAGVVGDSDAGVGTYGRSASGVALYAFVHGTGVAVRAESQNQGNLIEAWQGPVSPDLRFYVSHDGNVYADGTYHTPAPGFAQLLPGAAGLEAGDVLVVGADGQLARCSAAWQPTVVGVYAPQAAFVAGAAEEGTPGSVPLAVMGVVPAKVSAENGPIAPGDLLVAAAVPGHAMAAGANPPPGTVVGKALGALDRDTGIILMLVMLH